MRYAHTMTFATVAVLAAASASFAQARNFSFLYESTTINEGQFQYRQWVTWSAHKEIDYGYDRLDFRHEFALGLADRMQVSILVPDWYYEDGRSVDDSGVEFEAVSFQGLFGFTDAERDEVGSAAFGEFRIGDEIVALEGRLILDKKIEQIRFAYNLGLEAAWTGSSYQHDDGLLTNAIATAYHLSPEFTLGAELVHEAPIPDWHDFAKSVVWLGPNASYQNQQWWITLTPLFQVTNVDTEPDFRTRLLFGITF